MANTAGIGQLLTVLALIVAFVGIVLTHHGVDDLRVASATVFSTTWLSLSMLSYYRRSTLQRLRAQKDPLGAERSEL